MINVGRNQSAVFGTIDGVKFKNVPFTLENYTKLQTEAKVANAATNKEAYDQHVAYFLEVVNLLAGDQPVKKEVKVGSGNLSLVLRPVNDRGVQSETGILNRPFLFNGKVYSKFYIPEEIVARIEESESKGIEATPYYKFLVRILRNPKLTQDKFNRISKYITKTWVDPEEKEKFLKAGFSEEEAIKKATVDQVGITMEGLLVTYKVSQLVGEGLTQYPDEEEYSETGTDEEDEDECDDLDGEEYEDCLEDREEIEKILEVKEEELDLSEFKFVPVRNSKGHFYKRGSDDYIREYNIQLEAFKATLPQGVKATTVIEKSVDKKVVKEKVVATAKAAEDYLFIPAYQGYSGDAFYCGDTLGHNIKVGKRHYLPHWSQVDTNDSTSARPGLHVGGLDYIRGIHEGNTRRIIHNIFVDPQYIGAVVSVEHGDGAMRVKEYFVHSSFIGPNRGLYHSSTYAAQTDEEWNKALNEAMETVRDAEARIAAIELEKAVAQSLIDNTFV